MMSQDSENSKYQRQRRSRRMYGMVWVIAGVIGLLCLGPIMYGVLLQTGLIKRASAQQNTKSQLRGIYHAAMNYYLENETIPDEPMDLVFEDHAPIALFLNPRVDDFSKRRAEARAFGDYFADEAAVERLRQWLRQHNDFSIDWSRMALSIKGDRLVEATGDQMIVGHEAMNLEKGVFLLFADGRSRFCKHAEISEVMAKSDALWKKLEAMQAEHLKRKGEGDG